MAVWVACSLAKGKSYFSQLSELRLKESDRIAQTCENFKLFGIKTHSVKSKSELIIYGNSNIKTNKLIKIPRVLDHRVVMCMHVLANVTGCKVLINGFETVTSSFPGWLKLQKNKFGSKHEIIKN